MTYEAGRKAYWQRSVAGHHVSFYPVGAAIAAVPFYAPAVVLRGAAAAEGRSAELEKTAAAGIVAVSVALIYALLRGVAGRRMTIAATVAYALGSSSLSASSQALWQHGPSQLAIAWETVARARPPPRCSASVATPRICAAPLPSA